jgi:hypothetical protein
MKRFACLLAVVAAATTTFSVPAGAVAGFSDVAATDYWARPVQWMVDNDITTGTGEGCFSPTAPVTRGQAAAFMWRMEGEPAPGGSHGFVDVTASWQDEAVAWMVANEITTGTSPMRYSPDAPLTRGQLAALLHRLAGEPSASGHPFRDVVASWQQTPVAWMIDKGITTGTSPTTFSPDTAVTRGQLATFFYRYKGSPSVVVSPMSPACTGLPPVATPTTPELPASVDCTATTSDPWADVWFDMHYRNGASSCDRPDFDAAGATRIVDRNHPNASDSNAGTASAPWKTIVHAAAAARSGEVVLVKAGTYDDGRIEPRTSNVIFSAFPGDEHEVVIEGWGIRAIGTSGLVIHGFSFRNIANNAIQVVGPGVRNVVIADNDTYETEESGVSIRGVFPAQDPGNFDGVRDILIIGNRLRRGALRTSEVLSIGSGVVNIDIVANELAEGGPVRSGGDEGIALKEGVRHARIYGNVVHHLADRGIHIDGGSASWDALITGVEIFDNVLYANQNQGLWVTTEGMGDVDGVYIHDNVAYGNATYGFLVYDHPHGNEAGGTVKNVVFEHNVAFGNGADPWFGGFRVDHPTATGIVFRNNISWGNNGTDMKGDPGTVFDNNLCADSVCEIRSNPRFVDAPSNFGLAIGSPARGAATDGSDLGLR